MTVKEVADFINETAPFQYAESYDNSSLQIGNVEQEVKGILCSLDCTEIIIDEAITSNCNLIICHHPVLFKGLKQLTGKTYVERTVIKALQNNIAVIAAHTNLDNYRYGVNNMICDKLGLVNRKILAPKSNLLEKLIVFCPQNYAGDVKTAMFKTGAGSIGNYDCCSFNTSGQGTFRAGENTNPHVGNKNELHTEDEIKIEVIVEKHLVSRVLSAAIKAHPYEEPAYDRVPLKNVHNNIGSGMIGETEKPVETISFLKHIKEQLKTDCLRHTAITSNTVQKIAVCGGAGSFLLSNATAQKADIFITGDYKYHDFFDADGKIIIADPGHYESEQFTPELLHRLLREKFPTFAVRISEVNTNPISYL